MRKSEKDAEARKLRQENADLRRTVARLRKSLEKAAVIAPEEDEPPAVKSEVYELNGGACPKCGNTHFTLFHTPQSKIRICAGCKSRTKV